MKHFYQECWLHSLLGIIFLYSILAFSNLGTDSSPGSIWECNEKDKEILLDFGEEAEIAAIVYYLGNYGNRGFSMEYGSDHPVIWNSMEDLLMSQVYQWRASRLQTTCRYLRLTTKNVYTQIGEMLFIDRDGNRILPVNADMYPGLFDEAECYMEKSTYETGTVFDEPVYARTAYEYLNGMRPFEDTHPPLGKLLIAPGIAFFGMNPVGWRFMGAAAGVILLTAVAWFSRKLFLNPWISVAVTAIFAFDFMNFTHSRLAQVDTFLVCFILGSFGGMYLFASRLLKKGACEEWKEAIKYLLVSGCFLGLAVSCKWSGAYILPELLLIALFSICSAYRDGRMKKEHVERLLLWGAISHILIPAVIYVISYIPYIPVEENLGFWEGMIKNQLNMFRYHTSLSAANPESAKWFQWPLIAIPMTYCNLENNGVKECVYLLGNPVVWFAGIAAVFYCMYDVWNTKDKRAGFLLFMYLAPLLPWILVPRSSFLYHYYPSLPALVLMLGHIGDKMKKNGIKLLIVIAAASVIVFGIFYPILSGCPVSSEYVDLLEWLPWWEF